MADLRWPAHINQIITGDCLDVLKTIPDGVVQCCVTSPPYWGLRDYGVDGQLGLEPTPEEYVAKMVEVLREVRRVLRDDGTLWLNLGDSYAGSWGAISHDLNGKAKPSGYNERPPQSFIKSKRLPRKSNRRDKAEVIPGRWGGGNMPAVNGLKPKDLCGIPWRLALALQADSWWLRQDIIWAKPNPMPESVTDRCTKAHEYLFLLTKSATYYYDQEAIKIVKAPSTTQDIRDNKNGKRRERNYPGSASVGGTNLGGPTGLCNRRSVWIITTEPHPYAHFATFPRKLVEPCIMAGSSEKGNCSKCGKPWVRQVEKGGGSIGRSWHNHDKDLERGQRATDPASKGGSGYYAKTIGWAPSCDCGAPTEPPIILDPFSGSGTTGLVAKKLGRLHILIDLSAEYNKIAEQRLAQGELF